MAQFSRSAAKKEYDSLYAAARVRALEAHICSREALERLCELPSSAQVLTALPEFGATVTYDGEGRPDAEGTLLSILRRATVEVGDAGADEALLAVVKYPYDCNNAKAVIKCTARGVDPAPMIFDFGTVPADRLPAPTDSAVGSLPTHMAQAFAKASAAYPAGGNPQVVDALLDAACYRDMAEAANGSGCALAVWYVAAKADYTNLCMCVRLLRMHAEAAGRSQLSQSLLAGGTWDADKWLSLYDAGEEALWDAVHHSPLDLPACGTDTSLAALELAVDDCIMTHVRLTHFVPFGPDVIFAYLLANEAVVRNLRILLSGKDAGMTPADIRERMRLCYV